MNSKRLQVLGAALATMLVAPVLAQFVQPPIYLNGSAVRESVGIDDTNLITGKVYFRFTKAMLDAAGTVSGTFSQTLTYCADNFGIYDPSCATGKSGDLATESSGDVTCLAKDAETGDIWFAGRFTKLGRDPRLDNEEAYTQAQAEVVAGRLLLIGRVSDEDDDKLIDHASFFNTPRLVALPNVLEAGRATYVSDLKSWEKALGGPVTAQNACLDKDAFFLRVGFAEVLPGNTLRFTQKNNGKLVGKVYDGRFPIPRSAPPASVVDYSGANPPTSASSLGTQFSLTEGSSPEGAGGGGGGYSGGSAGLKPGDGGGGGGSYFGTGLNSILSKSGASGSDGRVSITKVSDLNQRCPLITDKSELCRDCRPYTHTFYVTGNFEYFTVPETTEYCVAVLGAAGGNFVTLTDTLTRGWGARITATIDLDKNQVLRIGVGQKGMDGHSKAWEAAKLEELGLAVGIGPGGGGGGASSIVKVVSIFDQFLPFNSPVDNIVVMAAGGGGAASVYHGGPGLATDQSCEGLYDDCQVGFHPRKHDYRGAGGGWSVNKKPDSPDIDEKLGWGVSYVDGGAPVIADKYPRDGRTLVSEQGVFNHLVTATSRAFGGGGAGCGYYTSRYDGGTNLTNYSTVRCYVLPYTQY